MPSFDIDEATARPSETSSTLRATASSRPSFAFAIANDACWPARPASASPRALTNARHLSLAGDARDRDLRLLARERPNLIHEITMQGGLLRTVRVPGDRPEGLALAPSGQAFLAQDSGGVLRIDP